MSQEDKKVHLTPFRREMLKRLHHLFEDDTIRSETLDHSVSWEAAVFVLGCEQGCVEQEALQYVKKHPNASIEELWEFLDSVTPPIEIVDDDELTEDEL
ncbi:MAG: hypothetical protein IJ484_08115 [Oscillospiraceae bacterium]|nr:hypothetical protein [Oscillospiraceae bacterium]